MENVDPAAVSTAIRVLVFAAEFKRLWVLTRGELDPELYLAACAEFLERDEREWLRSEVMRITARRPFRGGDDEDPRDAHQIARADPPEV